ncbi:MAG: hypothetical protein D6812_05410 [Deltaproteobacteria bacterium]|nr:MAG: hypothetical protein D6812_05410 [Deltaproteobacteria bacterium]
MKDADRHLLWPSGATILLFALCLHALPAPLHGEAPSLAEKLDEYARTLAQLRARHPGPRAKEALEQAEVWLEQARAFDLSGQKRRAEARAELVSVQLDYLRALLMLEEMTNKARKLEEEAKKKEEEAEQIEQRLERAREKLQRLRRQEEENR